MRYINFLLVILLFSKYSMAQRPKIDTSKQHELFTKFVNSNEMAINRDSERVYDKKFSIQIPHGLQDSKIKTDNYFLHLLDFKGGKKIVLLYQPFDTIRSDKQNLNLSYTDFGILCSQLGLSEKLNGIKLLKNRLFGLKMIGKEKFFVIYLNVNKQEVEVYNYAINSLTLTSVVNQ